MNPRQKKEITHSQLRLQNFILQYQQPELYQCCPVTLCVSLMLINKLRSGALARFCSR